MLQCHWKCHQNVKESKYPLAVLEEESDYAVADGSLGVRWTRVQHHRMVGSSRMSMMNARSVLNVVVMKRQLQSKWVSLDVHAMV